MVTIPVWPVAAWLRSGSLGVMIPPSTIFIIYGHNPVRSSRSASCS
jgi:TRAP-type C4-dicarboxylate transport system permease large subunit